MTAQTRAVPPTEMRAPTATPAPQAAQTSPNAIPADAPPAARRGRGRVALMLAAPVALALAGGVVWFGGGRYESTENAYLQQPKVEITAEASGRVVEASVMDNAVVAAGDLLFRIDPEPYRIALAQADAALAQARIDVARLRAAYSQALAQQQAAANDVDYLQREFTRQSALSARGVSSEASLDVATRDLRQAHDAKAGADEAVAGALAALGGDPNVATEDHPSVRAAQARRDQAALDLAHTEVRAPAAGVVAQAASFKTGEYVAAGAPLFALVETGDTWVEANFKETQLTHLEPGQRATVTFDTFPDVELYATVESIGAGTGAEFALLPAQNATGNWVKVTQRVPVRLRVDDPNAAGLALRTGMSAEATVDTGTPSRLAALFGATAQAAD